MKLFLLEVGSDAIRQFRITACEFTSTTAPAPMPRDGFKPIGLYEYPECLRVLQSYLELEQSQ